MKKNILKKVLGLLLSFVFTLGLVLTINTGETQAATVSAVYKGVDYSAVFNYQYYYKMYPDLQRGIGLDAAKLLKHFVENGMAEGRQGRQSFNVRYYQSKYPDLKKAFGNNYKTYYMHYINNGKAEGRIAASKTVYLGVDYGSVYNPTYYANKYPDLKRAYGNNTDALITHFVENGMSEGRRGNVNFDVKFYRYGYSDLRNGFGTNYKAYYMHYIRYGKKEGRRGYSTSFYNGVDYSTIYSFSYYYNHYPDLKKAYGSNYEAYINHFIKNGMKEGRQGNSSFNVYYYMNKYPDLYKGYGTAYEKYYLHYLNYGKKEGRYGNLDPNYTGWYKNGGNKFYYKGGSILTGWQTINNLRYYFTGTGILKGVPGIDVSKYQGQIDWDAVKNAGVEFAIIRVGWGKDLTYQDDSMAIRNMQECERVGIPYGVYLYSYALNMQNAQSEVDHTLRLIKDFNPTIGVFIDIEDTEYYTKNGFPSNEMLNNIALLFNQKITAAGYKSGVYANLNYYGIRLTSPELDKYIKWLAAWYIEFDQFDTYKFWQYSSKGSVAGISGNVDMDVMFIN